jgi:hypothetical protein
MIDARNRQIPRQRRGVRGLTRVLGGTRPRRRDRSGVDEPQPWRPGPLVLVLTFLTGLSVLVFLIWLGWSVYVIVNGGPSSFGFDPDRRCNSLGFSCGAISNVLTSALLLALASFFVLWRLYGLLGWYRDRARAESRELVPTAGAIFDEVVGRDELCKVVMADLHERRPRPHVLVGGVGTGKTAVLVRLTEFLAEMRAVPVPIRLRDAADALDFESLAQERFLSEVNRRLISSSEGETIWRQLRKDRRIVVLADGLEEALVGTAAEPERDNIIRAAIRKAHQQSLPLVIASRPHDPLRATEAAMLMLEPLSYEAALAYIGSGRSSEDERRLSWIVETADVVEAPLYLQITRELHGKGLLDPSSAGQPGVVDTRGVDRSQLRLALLETWQRALVSGYLREDVPLNPSERLAAVEHLSALACVGLSRDRLEVEFDDLKPAKRISAELRARLAKIDGDAPSAAGVRNIDVRLAAAWAAQLDLIELRGNSVRFRHSLIQAYLGSRLLDVALQEQSYYEEALREPGPGREFLIALVLHSRAAARTNEQTPSRADPAPAADSPARRKKSSNGGDGNGQRRDGTGEGTGGDRADVQHWFTAPLRQTAAKRDDNKVLDMYAAALEIDCDASEPAHQAIADEIKGRWSRIHAQDPRTLEEGKLALVRRFGDAARRIDGRRSAEQQLGQPAYRQLYEIASHERSYPVQLAATQEIGVGGDAAYQALSDLLAPPCAICAAERGTTSAHSLPSENAGRDNEGWQTSIVSAWLAPMLVGSVGATGSVAERARADLDQWLRHVGLYGRRPGEEDLALSLEIAVAQGFKYAANRRPSYPDTRHEVRMYLAEQALEMLKSTEYWFSQLTLIQALCLLSLSDQSRRSGDRRVARPEAIVQHWLDVAGRESTDRNPHTGQPGVPHPLVREAAQLTVLALKTGRPQRYMWIDEAGVVGQVGSRKTSEETTYRKHRLWIPPSAGWTALNGRAQQLVADVLLLLNLADRGDQPRDRERRLKRSNRHDLPPCITRYRLSLDPGLTVGTATSSAPGISCVDGCAFELCPYPPKGTQPRVEMSEAFCRRQQTLLTRSSLSHRKAPWQEMRRGQLIDFWSEMAERARGPRPRSETRSYAPGRTRRDGRSR